MIVDTLKGIQGFDVKGNIKAIIMIGGLITAMALAMRLGICCYEEIRDEKEQEQIVDLWEVKEFYRCQILKEVAND